MRHPSFFPASRAGVLVCFLAALFLPFGTLGADTTVYTTVQLPDPLQDVGHSPRAAALGSAYTASEGTADSLYWNPAGLYSIADPQLSLVHQSWFGGLFRENATTAFPFSKAGVLGLGADYTGFGTLQGYDSNGDPTQTYQPYRVSMTLGWAFRFLQSLSLGIAGTGMLDFQSADYQYLSEYLTMGFLWSGFQPLKLGAFYSFANSDAPFDMGLFKVGASCPQTLIGKNPTLFLLDLSLPPHGVYALQAGMEQTLWRDIFVRAGYQWDLDNNDIPGFQGLTAGLGFRWEEWRLDYAFIPNGDLGTSQTLGLSYIFPESAPTQSEIPASPPVENSTAQPKEKPAPLPQASFKPADTLLPGDKIVNVEIDLSIPKDTSPAAQGPVSPQMAQNIHLLVQRVAQNPQNAQAWNTLGNLYWRVGRADYAVQCFEEVLQLQPSNQALKDWLQKYRAIRNNPATGKE